MKTTTLLICGILAATTAFAGPNDPVKRSDASMVFQKLDQSACEVLRIPYQQSTKAVANDGQTMSRSEMLGHYFDLYNKVKAKFRFMPVLAKTDPTKYNLSTADKAKGIELARWGFIPPVAPLLTAKTATLTTQQFGDSVGYFIARLAELTHKPSARYSPQLMGGNAPDAAPSGKPKSKKGTKSG